jgi:hypothetical protein
VFSVDQKKSVPSHEVYERNSSIVEVDPTPARVPISHRARSNYHKVEKATLAGNPQGILIILEISIYGIVVVSIVISDPGNVIIIDITLDSHFTLKHILLRCLDGVVIILGGRVRKIDAPFRRSSQLRHVELQDWRNSAFHIKHRNEGDTYILDHFRSRQGHFAEGKLAVVIVSECRL